MVISSAGLYNTFQKLLPPNIGENSYFHGICKNLKPAYAAMNVFLGFDASNEELGLKAQSIWAFTTNDSGKNRTLNYSGPPEPPWPSGPLWPYEPSGPSETPGPSSSLRSFPDINDLRMFLTFWTFQTLWTSLKPPDLQYHPKLLDHMSCSFWTCLTLWTFLTDLWDF